MSSRGYEGMWKWFFDVNEPALASMSKQQFQLGSEIPLLFNTYIVTACLCMRGWSRKNAGTARYCIYFKYWGGLRADGANGGQCNYYTLHAINDVGENNIFKCRRGFIWFILSDGPHTSFFHYHSRSLHSSRATRRNGREAMNLLERRTWKHCLKTFISWLKREDGISKRIFGEFQV